MPSAKKNYCDAAENSILPRPARLCSASVYDPSSASASKRPRHQLQRPAPFWKPPICSDRLPKKAAPHAAWQCIISYGSHWQFDIALLGLKGVGPSFMWKKFPPCDFHLKSADFWDLMQHVVVYLYRRFGITHRSHLQGSRNTKWISFGFLDPWRWNAQIVPKLWGRFTTTYCVTTQKSADLIYITTVTWTRAWLSFVRPLPESAKDSQI
jgi:hypothetical protein